MENRVFTNEELEEMGVRTLDLFCFSMILSIIALLIIPETGQRENWWNIQPLEDKPAFELKGYVTEGRL